MNPFDGDEPTVGNGVRPQEPESPVAPAGKNDATRIMPPPTSRPLPSRPPEPMPMPTTTEPALPAVIIDTARPNTEPSMPMPTTTERSMPAVIIDTARPNTEPSMPALMPATTQPAMPAIAIDAPTTTMQRPLALAALGVVPDEPFEYEKLSRKTSEYDAVHRTHPAAIAVAIVIVLLAVLLVANWLTEEPPDGSPGDPAAVRIQKLFSW